jgi:anti-sigma factor RsiW
MTDPKIPVTEDELHAFVDNELPAERRGDVEAWLAAHPDDAVRVQSWREMADALHARYDAVINEPVPQRLELERLVRQPRRWIYGAIAASLVAFVAGGAAGWVAHGARSAPSLFQNITDDALDAHKLYVVEVRHPVEVPGDEKTHLQQWLTRRCGRSVNAPELEAAGLKLVGGRLLPGPSGPASFLMYEGPSGERFTIYYARTDSPQTAMRYRAGDAFAALYWVENGLAYVVSGPPDRERLSSVAQAAYDQIDKAAPAGKP